METITTSRNGNVKGINDNHTTKKPNLLKLNKKLEELISEGKSQTNEAAQNLENDPLMVKIQNIHHNMADRMEAKPGHLPEKYFMTRNSLLTDLAELPRLRTLRSVFVVVFISLLINAVSKDVAEKGKITLGLQQFLEGFNNFHMAVFIWISMFVSTVGVYAAFLFWATVRVKLLGKHKSFELKLWDCCWLVSFVIYCLGFCYVAINAIVTSSLQIMVSKIFITEVIRMLMKTYAFVRSNVPRVLKYKLHDEDKILCPKFSNFLYFLFAPTLIYKDSYPRTTHVRWDYVASCFVQIFAACVCIHLIQEYVVVYSFKDYDLKTITWMDVQLLMVGNSIPSMFHFICWLFIICHASQNVAAEMLRFGDRLFYKDWWNSTSVEEIFRGWNVIVYDWFYTYIYKDMYEIVLPKNTTAAKLVQYSVMFMFHECVYSFPYGFYYLVMFFVHILGTLLLTLLKYKSDLFMNSFILYGMTIGLGILRTGLMIEYYARIECPVENKTLASYFIPRTFTCNL